MTVNDLTLRDWNAMAEMPALAGLLSNEHAAWLADFCGLTFYEAQECARRVAARHYICAIGECGHADADRPAGSRRVRRRRLGAEIPA